VSQAEAGRALRAFQRAVETGDLRNLVDMLAPDVVLMGDGGGIRPAVQRPVVGADDVARLLAQGLPRLAGTSTVEAAQVNGGPALIIRVGDEVEDVVAVRIDGGLISELYVVRNPEKLLRVERATAVSR
jgi:RNA polymerase sigma-70 factor (ECF subfamily)